MIDSDIIWAPAVVTVAYFARGVGIRWLDSRERAAKAVEERNEREAALAKRLDAANARADSLEAQWKTFQANHAAGRR